MFAWLKRKWDVVVYSYLYPAETLNYLRSRMQEHIEQHRR